MVWNVAYYIEGKQKLEAFKKEILREKKIG
jgi:hypothetical protein